MIEYFNDSMLSVIQKIVLENCGQETISIPRNRVDNRTDGFIDSLRTHLQMKIAYFNFDNFALKSYRRQAITWANAGLLSIELFGTNFGEIWIGILPFSFTKFHVKML